MNPFYPFAGQSAHIPPFRYRRRRLHFCGHILFLLALFLMKAGWVNGQDDNHLDGASDRNEIIGAGYDDYGAYVDIIITFFDDNDDDSWIEKGRDRKSKRLNSSH